MKLADLKAQLEKKADQVPEGWKMTEEWAAEWQAIGPLQASRLLRRAMDAGLCERRMFRVMRNCVRPVPHFKFRDTKTKRDLTPARRA